MQFREVDSYETLSALAAETVAHEIRRKPAVTMVAASGGSPAGTYRHLGERAQREPALFAGLRIVKLDEWSGLAMDDPASCEVFMQRHLVGPLQIPEARYLAFASNPLDPAGECARVSRELAAWGPADIAVLGLGLNGHLGFIEPALGFTPHAHVASLSEMSLGHPMLAEARRPVRHGLTLGMADLLACRNVLLLVSGAHKREAFARLRRPEVSTQFPASFLWLHPRVTCVFDHQATSGAGPHQAA